LCKPPAGGAMQEFIHRKNLEKYRQLLAETKDETQRRQLEKLLAEEVAKEPLLLKPRDDS
jgi:hypothetical protein